MEPMNMGTRIPESHTSIISGTIHLNLTSIGHHDHTCHIVSKQILIIQVTVTIDYLKLLITF